MISSSNIPGASDIGTNPVLEEEAGINWKRIFVRALPYWPLFPVAIALFFSGAYFYLKYQAPVFLVSARLVVNDVDQEKGNNLLQAFRPYSAVDKETEREKEILQSKGLVYQVVRDLQLNIQWTKKGRVARLPQFENLPLQIWLETPDSVKSYLSGTVHLVNNNRVEYLGKTYQLDSLEKSPIGKIRWHLADPVNFTNEWELDILPLKNAAAVFRGKLSATPISKQSSIIDLNILETVPARGELFLNALLEQYGKNNVEFKNRVYQNTVSFLEERLRQVSDELNGVESKLQTYRSKEGIFNLGYQGEQFLGRLRETDTKASETELQLTILKKIEQYVNSRNHDSQAIPATLGLTDPILLGLLNQLFQAEFELEKLKKLSGEKNPQLQVLEESLEKLRPSIMASINNLKISLQSTQEKLGNEDSRLTGQLKDIPQKERGLLEISRQQQIKNTIYTYLLQKREESLTAAAAQVPSHRVINLPEIAGQVAPQSFKVYSLVVSLAVMIVLIFIYFREFANNKVLFSSDIERITGVPLLGELVFSKRTEQHTVIDSSERLLIAEQIRDLRTNLSYTQVQKEGAQVILITSSISGEGKSFLSINLAAALSRLEKKVLLMECDLRKPVISKKLGIAKGKGLTDYLIGAARQEDILRPVEEMQNITVLSSGPVPPNPVELLMNGKFEDLINQLKQTFDYILIDSPPAGILTDAKVLAMVADSTIYVVRYNYTPADFMEFIRQQALKNTLPRISIVFNGVEERKASAYGYGYGYGYGGYITQEKTSKKGKNKR